MDGTAYCSRRARQDNVGSLIGLPIEKMDLVENTVVSIWWVVSVKTDLISVEILLRIKRAASCITKARIVLGLPSGLCMWNY